MRVFISRDLAPDSIFRQRLEAAGYDVIGVSLLQFVAVDCPKIPTTDWIFFYSKTAVPFFFEQVQHQQLSVHAKLAALGVGTAKAIVSAGYQLHFIGTGEPETSAQLFVNQAIGSSVLFPRAKHSRRSVQELLAGRIAVEDLIVYDNVPREDFILPLCDWLVFTSPLNAETYFQRYTLQAKQKIMAIGATTAGALRKLNLSNMHIASAPSEAAMCDLILETVSSS
jgi:uroporphyrinogen-III synthase